TRRRRPTPSKRLPPPSPPSRTGCTSSSSTSRSRKTSTRRSTSSPTAASRSSASPCWPEVDRHAQVRQGREGTGEVPERVALRQPARSRQATDEGTQGGRLPAAGPRRGRQGHQQLGAAQQA